MNGSRQVGRRPWQRQRLGLAWAVYTTAIAVMACGLLSGCLFGGKKKQQQPFFTSGSNKANERASQYMAKKQQLSGTGENGGGGAESTASSTGEPEQGQQLPTLYVRLGAEVGVSNIVADFLPRAMNDPRVNWERKDAGGGGFFSRKNTGAQWQATPTNVAILQKHLVEFIDLAAGGPTSYTGREIKSDHAKMNISNPEFDAVVGDLKASLDRLGVADREQKELLAIIETTRPLIVTKRGAS